MEYPYDFIMEVTETERHLRVWLVGVPPNHPCPSVLYNNARLRASAPPHPDWHEWWAFTRKERKRKKTDYMRTVTTSNEIGTLSTTFIPAIASGSLGINGTEASANSAPTPKLKEKSMHTTDPNSSAREHLNDRLDDIFLTKEVALKRHFGLIDDEDPKSGQELLDRILAGHFIKRDEKRFDTKNAYRYYCDGTLGAFRWRKPDLKEDQAGYDKAHDEMRLARNHTNDSIQILDPVKGLEELRKFETKTFH